MSTSNSFQELRRANPRSRPEFERSVEAAEASRTRIVMSSVAAPSEAGPSWPTSRRPVLRARVGLRAAGAMLVAAVAVTAFLTIGGPGGGGVEGASAAVAHAAKATAESAGFSGTATVVITHDGELWAAKTVRWHGGDLVVVDGSPERPGGRELRVVDDVMYGQEEDRWVTLGSPDSVDPDSGTTPDEYLAVTQADVSGDTLERITAGMTGLTTQQLEDGSIVYRGSVPAGLVAPEAGFKEGEDIRVFPFGYVAHDEADDPAAPLDAAITVSADGLISELAVEWGNGGSAWTYTVTYSDLGATGPIVAPENAEPFPDRIPVPPPTGS
jgi:hypothetical protein